MRVKKRVHKSAGYLFGGLLLALLALAFTSASTTATQAMSSRSDPTTSSNSRSAPLATNTPTCGLAWRGFSIPLPPGDSQLDGVAGVSANDVWAVGFTTNNGISQTLTMHWDGTIWSIVPSVNGFGVDSWLSAVATYASDDVWAVGGEGSSSGSHTFIEHWDGTAWTWVPSQNGSPSGVNVLRGVAIAGTDDIWAVGYYGSPPVHQNLTEHWNGSDWIVIPSPHDGNDDNLLHAVTAIGPSDVWAVGTHLQTNINFYRTTTMHWNGSTWTLYTSPPSYGHNYFFGVFAVSPNNVWAVGGEEDMISQWNGTSWGAAGPVVLGDLHGVSGSAQDDVWAVGNVTASGYYPTYHYDGSHWWNISSNSGSYLQSVVTLSRNDAWAVGFDDNNHALIERYSDPCATPTPTSTGTPPTATSTRTPTISPTATRTATATLSATPPATNTSTNVPTRTPTNLPVASYTSTITPQPPATNTSAPTAAASVTACPIQFTDVPTGSTFYSYVRCLVCRGIVNGYSDGTFRPNNNVTRGQVAKILSNAAGYSEPHTEQVFQDVPVSHVFYIYIARIATKGYINGYPCGGLGEPCVPPDNLPYYRPNNNVTRGQLSKPTWCIRSATCSGPITGQTFEDVPPGSTYYAFIEGLASDSVMSGYPCGGSGEPCVSPTNRPYFRPGHNVTRGQTTKIVANGFFPSCQPANQP